MEFLTATAPVIFGLMDAKFGRRRRRDVKFGGFSVKLGAASIWRKPPCVVQSKRFVTGYTEHVFEGYTVGALGYLLKPVREDQLKEVLSRAAAALLREEEEVYLCRRGDVTYRIPRKKILYFTSDRRQVTCVTTEKHYTFYGKLDQVEEELKDSFVRIHQRYLVRTQAVQQISGSQVLVGGQTLPISRSCQQAAMIALTRASLEE